MRRLIIPIVMALTVGACSAGSGSSPVSTGGNPGGSIVVGNTAPPETPPPPPTCPSTTPITATATDDPSVEFIPDDDPGLASVTISQATFVCATDVVVVEAGDLERIALAAILAAHLQAPLLVGSIATSGLISFELDRLAPARVVAIGDDAPVQAPEWTDVERLDGDPTILFVEIENRLGTGSSIPLPAAAGTSTLVATLNAIRTGSGLTPTATTTTSAAPTTTAAGDTTTTTQVAAQPAEPEKVPGLTAGAGTTGVALLVDGNSTATALAAIASAESSGALVALVDERDLRTVPEAGRALQSTQTGAIHVIGDVGNDAAWELEVIRTADELPGGGFLILPRIFVALYGNPLTSALGVLGEQSPADSVTRIREIAAPYQIAEVPVLPAFEIITTVAAADIGPDGDYSNEMPPEVIQPWVDIAGQEGVYVILDLQSGRDSFLNQAKEYEQFLLLPHVGLALDPEWRLTPDQVHLRQIGRVDAAEVNQVIEWMANLVRENNLPQKMLLLHQFRFFMIENRENLETPPELQLIIQMDGQGAVPDKYATWGALTEGWETHPWAWGWKNFYDEDSPGPIPATEVLSLIPQAVLVSYQ